MMYIGASGERSEYVEAVAELKRKYQEIFNEKCKKYTREFQEISEFIKEEEMTI